jgi:hypothetical protein
MTESPSVRPIDFATFALSLGTSALVQLGDAPDPDGHLARDLDAARQSIDILVMLEEKTRGNLSAAEAGMLKNLLHDLRMRWLAARNKE